MVWVYTLISVIIVSLISLIGIIFISTDIKKLKKLLLFLVSFAVGSLFGDAFIHLLPESFEKIGSHLVTALLIVAGILIFFALEKFLRWRHCHVVDSEEHTHPVVTMNIVGDAVHNLIDGMIIGASFLISFPIGLTTTLAVIFHEIPQEIGDFGILIYAKLEPKKALSYNFLSALFAVIGGIISLLLGAKVVSYSNYLLPITAGGFIYIAGADLIPELKHDVKLSSSVLQFFSIVLGIVIMAILTLLE